MLLLPPFFDAADEEIVAMLDEFLQLPGLASGTRFIKAYGEPEKQLNVDQTHEFFNKLFLEEDRPKNYRPHQPTMELIEEGMWKLRKTKIQ